MSADFIAIKNLLGELKISHKKGDFGLTVTDREFVLQRPHMNIHVLLEDIVSIVPDHAVDAHGPKRFADRRGMGVEAVRTVSSIPHYRIYVRAAQMHNRSGIMTLRGLLLVIPVLDELLQVMAQHGGLQAL
jgi:hypothetical protein